MLVIDENMFRLAKMQEALLKVDNSNTNENLRKYKEIVIEIDTKAFNDILDEVKHIDEHNHTLESELEFLEKIVDIYNQLNELQLNFKRVCELYGDDNLKLSDLSQLNIDYINNRINTINGYLINIKNIEKNKIKIQELNDKLVDEEKKKVFLDNKLLEMEETLKNNFINAEGRLIVNGNLQYISVITEYNSLDFDINELLNDKKILDDILSEYNKKRYEVSESVKAAEICYNSLLTIESKQVLNEIKKEYLLVKYKLTMLKILIVLSKNTNDYDDFIKKREQLIDLIKYRLECLNGLDIKMSIDPFSRIKINDQLETVLSFMDNSKIISRIMKEISELNSRTEEMVNKNNEYLSSLSEINSLIESRMSFSDIDIETSDHFDFEDMLMKKEFADNQIVDVRNISNKFNMYVVEQKTSSVIKRVNQMMNSQVLFSEAKTENVSVPELVIVPKKEKSIENVNNNSGDSMLEEKLFDNEGLNVSLENEEVDNWGLDIETNEEEFTDDIVDDINDEDDLDNKELVKIEEIVSNVDESSMFEPSVVIDINQVDSNMFETVIPFDEPTFFVDRAEEDLTKKNISSEDVLTMEELSNLSKKENNLELCYTHEEQLPDAFWVVQENNALDEESQIMPSFDDQINKLLSTENVDMNEAKVKKRAA